MQGKQFIVTFHLIVVSTLMSFTPNGENAPQIFLPAAADLHISPATIPDGQYGTAYKDQHLKVTGGKGTYAFSVSSGSLPPGIPLSGNGILSGAPTAAGTFKFTVTAVGSNDHGPISVSQDYILVIDPATLTVIANAQKKDSGAADPVFTYTSNGFVNGDDTGVFTGSLTRAPGETIGTYPITMGSLSAGLNYTISYTGNYLTISAPPTPVQQHITWTQSLLVGCNTSTTLQLTATASSGLPVTYSVADTSIAAITGNILTLLRPGSTVITANQPGDASHTAAQPVADTLLYQSASLIRQHWNDVIIFDNSSGDFVQWQWYKNGQAVPDATSPFYSETPTLNGQYYVIATTTAGRQIQTCVLTIAGDTVIPGGIKIHPNPISSGAAVTVTNNYTATALQGAVLQVIDLNGKMWQQLTSVQPSMQITMPSEHGIYIIRLLLANGQMASTNALVLN
ncbi:MAG: T9SS type A sorting domain-containing protein [Sphingobacteriales bacterium]|nr:T9SS type A sorting domain-containing protein [Sphingobacteriales bacterium]